MIKIDPDTVELNLSGNNRASLHFSTNEARYHIWITLDPLAVSEPILYKNPPLGEDRYTKGDGERNPRHFDTRRLDAAAAANKPVVDRLIEIARERGLVAVAREKRAEAERIKALRDAARRRLHIQRDLGPQLVDVLRDISDHVESKRAADPAFAEEGKSIRARMIELLDLADASYEEARKVQVRDRRKPETPPSVVYAINDRAAIESACLGRAQGIVLDDVLPEDIEVVSSTLIGG